MTDFAATYATLSLGFTCREWGEVIMQQETLIALVQDIVYHFLVKFGS